LPKGLLGKFANAPYFYNFERWAGKLARGEVDDEAMVIILQRGTNTWTPYSAIWLDDGRLTD